MDSPPNFWSPSVTDAFFYRLCAAGTLHRQTYTTYEKKLGFLAARVGLSVEQFVSMNPLEYEKHNMWGWPVPLGQEERRSMEA